MLPAGTLQDTTTCTLEVGGQIVQAEAVNGEIRMEADVLPTSEQAKDALVETLGVPQENIKVKVEEISSGRRLAAHTRLLATSNIDALQPVAFKVSYQLIVPEGKTVANLTSSIKAVSTTAVNTFVAVMETAGVKVVKKSINVSEPKMTPVLIEVNRDGKVKDLPAPIDTTPTLSSKPAPGLAPATKEDGWSIAAIVGCVIGGAVGAAVLGGFLYWWFVIRRKVAEA